MVLESERNQVLAIAEKEGLTEADIVDRAIKVFLVFYSLREA